MQEQAVPPTAQAGASGDGLDERVQAIVEAYLRQREEQQRRKPKKMALIATRGTLDWAYPPLILATTAAALGWEVGIFFTFYGLNVIHKEKGKALQVAPLANPAMPMPVPVPNLLGAVPGMTPMATTMMKRMFKGKGVASIEELVELAVESGVKLFPCSMTVEVFGYHPSDFIEGVEPVCGAAHFLRYASDADISLFV